MPRREAVKGWFICRGCKGSFYDYLDPSGREKNFAGTPIDTCRRCSRTRRRYRHEPAPDQGEFDFESTSEFRC